MDSDLQSQLEEVEVLQAIYGNEWIVESECSYRISLKSDDVNRKEIDLLIQLPPEYPSKSGPKVLLTLGNLSKEEKKRLQIQLDKICEDSDGQSVLHQLIEAARDSLNVNVLHDEELDGEEDFDASSSQNLTEPNSKKLVITSGSPLQDRKSVFQAHLAKVYNREDVNYFVESLKQNKKIAMATHNIIAYRIIRPDQVVMQDSEDDGEFGAGSRLSHLLEIVEAKNVVVMVTRWYGGIHLGGDRFKVSISSLISNSY